MSENLQNIQHESYVNWKVKLAAGEQTFAEMKIHRGLFQEDSHTPLVFVIAMQPLNYILRKYTGDCKFTKSQEKINHQIYMDEINTFAKNEKE